MIYLEETFNLVPASPETMDTFVDLAQEDIVPCYERLGARLAAAWYSDAEVFAQVMQVLEFDDLPALGAFRAKASDDQAWSECERRIEDLAPVRRSRLNGDVGASKTGDIGRGSCGEPRVSARRLLFGDIGREPRHDAGVHRHS